MIASPIYSVATTFMMTSRGPLFSNDGKRLQCQRISAMTSHYRDLQIVLVSLI